MSVEIENELSKLKSSQKELLSQLNKFDGLDDDEVRIPILNLVNTFNDGLIFLKNELEFEYEIDFNKPIRTTDRTLLSYVLEFDKSKQFLDSFKKNFVTKQNELKQLEIQRFQQLKAEKYGPKVSTEDNNEDPVSSKSKDSPAVSTNSRIMSTTRKITSKLSQSSQILQSSLIQSQLNMDELSVQSDSLTYLSDRYGYLKGVLEKSDGFINDIKLSGERDKKFMMYALIFFGLCVLKVFWSRLLKLPARFIFNIIFYIFKLSLATIGLISPKRVEKVDFASGLTSGDPIATILTTGSYISEDQTISSSIDLREKSGMASESTSSENNGSEDPYDEELSRIIDEL